MQQTAIDFHSTNAFSTIICDYIDEHPDLKPFYKYPADINSFNEVIAHKEKETIDRETLVGVLLKQYEAIDDKAKVVANIQSLLDKNTFTVTTGHQLNIFTGPLYFIYKIFTTIRLAEEVETKNAGKKIVPVYWMATEDHDFEEINHIHLFNKKISWETEMKGATGNISTHSIQNTLEELKTILGDSDNAQKLYNLIATAYTSHNTLCDATRALVHELFKEYGLIILDAGDAELKAIFKPIIIQDIVEQHSFEELNKTNELLSEKYAIQVNPREINFFYLREGYRERIINNGTSYITNDNQYQFTKEELLNEIESHPGRFSPNVVTRPLYEEVILPNLAYIGGPGELAYWLELKGMFDFYKVNFPVLVLRNCFLVIDEASSKRIEKLQINIEELFNTGDQLAKDFVNKNATDELSLSKERLQLERLMDTVSKKAVQLDPSLKGSVEAEKAKFLNGIHALEQKLIKAEKKKFEIEINQLQKLKEKLFPNNGLQERYENLSTFYLKEGKEFLNTIYKYSEGLPKRFKVLS